MSALTQVQDWRRTAIGHTPLGLSSDPFVTDAAVAAFDQRKEFHTALDRACSEKSITLDRAERLHARLDRLMDEHPDMMSDEEPPESESDAEPEDEVESVSSHEVPASQISDSAARRSVAMDGHRCKECRIQDNAADPGPGVRRTQESVISFWKKLGVRLRPA